MKHRAANKVIANTLGYYWLPCPVCGQEFGGHEHRSIPNGIVASIPAPDGPQGLSLCICPDCAHAGRGRTDPILDAKWAALFGDGA